MENKPRFNGPDYQPELDQKRLATQHEKIKKLVQDHKWRTLQEIATALGVPEASVSAQLRHMRKPRFGAHKIDKRRRVTVSPTHGLWEYRLDPTSEIPACY